MRHWALVLVGLASFFAGGILVVGLSWARINLDPSSPGNGGSAIRGPAAAEAKRSKVVALAKLEPGSGLIRVSVTPGPRVLELRVQMGDEVQAGDILAILEGNAERQTELKMLQTQRQDADRRIAKEQENGKILLEQAQLAADRMAKLNSVEQNALRAKVDLARAALKLAEDQMRRMESLRANSTVPQEQIDRQVLAINQAKAEMESAERSLQLQSTKAEFDKAELGLEVRKIEVGTQRAISLISTESLDLQIELAQQRLAATVLRAPSAGRILDTAIRPGEVVGHEPMIILGDTTQMAAVAEVYETDAPLVQVGQSARVRILGREYPGRVDRVGLLVGRNRLVSLDPTARSDARVVPVRILLDPEKKLESWSNLQVTAEIAIGESPSASGKTK